jgi:hypothetical protein
MIFTKSKTSVWGLITSVAESVTVRHMREYRGFVRFPLWHSLDMSDCWGPLCSRVVDGNGVVEYTLLRGYGKFPM